MKEKAAIVYLHGKGGNSAEAKHYQMLCPNFDVYGLDYSGSTPWETKEEIQKAFDQMSEMYDKILILANSIGAFFAMHALQNRKIEKALFISPIVNMEQLIADMMIWAGVTEADLYEKGEIPTNFGETLSWRYLQYVRSNPIVWKIPTDILYAGNDHLTSRETITAFADVHSASLTILENGEHWFHTEEQVRFLDAWVQESLQYGR